MSVFQPFLIERMMSKFEQDVDYNLSESGVHPMLVSELLADQPGGVDRLLATDLNYPYANGNPELRKNIAALYDGATPDNVLVTVGAAEANFLAVTTLLEPGDEVKEKPGSTPITEGRRKWEKQNTEKQLEWESDQEKVVE